MRIDRVIIRLAAVACLFVGAAWAGENYKEQQRFEQDVYKACAKRYETVELIETCRYWFLGD